MTDARNDPPKADKPDADGPAITSEMVRTGGWVAAAGMGIGSAALVAALLYSRPPKPDVKPAAKPVDDSE